ncbi:MAG: type II CAAX endopeptidase family protein [Candidatus Berkelbacteria bacterium]
MTDIKNYSKREKMFLLVFLLIGIAGFLIFWKLGDRAFQQFDIRFKITKNEATSKSIEFAKEMNLSTDGYKQITIFDTENGKEYLEKEVGIPETSKLAENDAVIWDYTTRFVKPLQKEEFSVKYLPNGRFVGFTHTLDENAKGEFITVDKAKSVAEQFLTTKSNINLSDWYLVSSENLKKPNRIDTTFTYEKLNSKAKDATLRLTVGLSGSEVTSYSEFVKVPESWERGMTNEVSKSFLSQGIFETLYFLLLIIPAIILFFTKLRKTNFRYKFAFIVSGIFFIIYLLNSLNLISLALFDYNTTQSWASFIGSVTTLSVLSALLETISLFFVLVVGEVLYREAFPDKMALEKIFAKSGLRTKTVNYFMLAGVSLAFVMIVYQIVYYFLGHKAGFWAPAEISYSNLYSTYAPWIYPLMIGFIAAVSEEVAFRLFGITFLKKFLKNTWVAIIVSGVIWAFLHSSYTQIPWFVRGLELSIVGVAFGIIYVRFGLIPSIIAHFTFNAFTTAMSYTSSGNWLIISSSILVSLLPAIIAIIIYIRSLTIKFAVDEKDLSNRHIPLENKSKDAASLSNVAPSIFQPIAKSYKLILPISAVIGLAIGIFIYLKINQNITPTSIDAGKAIEMGINVAKDEAVSTNGYSTVATYGSATPVSNFIESNPSGDSEVTSESTQKTYLEEIGGFDAVNNFYKRIPANVWSVRLYKDMQKEEYIVDLLPDGSYYRLTRVLDESASGYVYTEDQAVALATDFVTARKLMTDFKLVDQKSQKRTNRTDYKIIFEENGNKVGDATFRTSVTILGKNIAGFEQYYKVPDSWVREQKKQTTSDFVIFTLIVIFGIAVLVLCVIAFIRALKNGQINFKRVMIFAGILICLDLVAYFNNFSSVFAFYDTTMPFWRYFLMDFIFLSLGASLIISTILAFAVEMAVSFWGMIVFSAKTNKSRFKELLSEGLIVGYSLPLVLFGIEQIISYFAEKYGQANFITDSISLLSASAAINSYLPFLGQITSSGSLLAVAATLSLVVLVIYLFTKKWHYTVAILAIAGVLLSVIGQRNFTDGLISVGATLIALGISTLVIWKIMRKNPISYIIAIWTSIALPLAFQLLYQGTIYYRFNGWIVIVLTFAPILIYLSNYIPKMKMKNLRKLFWK